MKTQKAHGVFRFRTLIFLANLLTLLLGVVWFMTPSFSFAGQTFGVLLAALVVFNSGSAALEHRRVKRAWAYLIFTILVFLVLPVILLIRSSASLPPDWLTGVTWGMTSLPVLLGILLTVPGGETEHGVTESSFRSKGKRSALLITAGVFTLILSSLALYLSIKTFRSPDPGLLGVMLPQFLPYFALSFAALGGMAWRYFRRWGFSPLMAFVTFLPGLAAAVVAFLPVFQTPGVVEANSRHFRTAYGSSALDLDSSVLRETPFSLGEFFTGTPTRKAILEANLTYLIQADRAGKTHTFLFDRWLSESSASSPSKPNPVLIRIHGGAWVSGDKGIGNMNRMNRYFASQGYQVFDIQYGLNDTAKFALSSPTPPEVMGPYSIDDMVGQISAFSTWLADHAGSLNIDTDRVFVSGASAGGHLVLASALARSSGYDTEHPGMGLDQRLHIRGLIPFYPAIGYAAGMGVPASPALDDPTSLLGTANPPALVYQGGLDGIVSPDRVRDFAIAYNKSGAEALALMEFPLAGHGSDLIFWSPYNQVFVYYMERFMAFLSD